MTWKKILRTNITSLETLASFLELSETNRSKLLKNNFPINIPLRLAEKMKKDDITDPLFLQFVPLINEKITDGKTDPVSDLSFQKSPRLLQKYEGRALIISTGACAMHCRYCFRKNFPYKDTAKDFAPALNYLKKTSSIHEAILSGGDPLSLPDHSLETLINEISAIDHIKLIRFHTRFPIGIPERISQPFLAILKESNKQIIFVVHINHPKELDSDVISSLKCVQKLGIPVYNQSVLLKDVNDDVASQKELCLALISNGITPYYLHQLDPVEGADHFEVPVSDGKKLIDALRSKIPGYAVPTYVQELPGKTSKTPM